jgi:hypothetical protein
MINFSDDSPPLAAAKILSETHVLSIIFSPSVVASSLPFGLQICNQQQMIVGGVITLPGYTANATFCITHIHLEKNDIEECEWQVVNNNMVSEEKEKEQST